MLIYVQLFGGALQRTLPVDIRADATVAELQKRILQLHPDIIIKRCIFAGKQLDDLNKSIAQYDVYKESTIQVFTARIETPEEIEEKAKAAAAEAAAEKEKDKEDKDKKPDEADAEAPAAAPKLAVKVVPPSPSSAAAPSDDALPPMSSRPLMVRQPTNEVLQYGDVLVVKLLRARSLLAVDWNGTSDPYAVLALDKQTSKSSVIKKNLNPQWDETFVFHVDLQSALSAGAAHNAGKTVEEIGALSASGAAAALAAAAPVRSASAAAAADKKSGKPKPPPPSHNLSIMLWDHDWVRTDESLGWAELEIDSIPRNQYLERTLTLQGVKNGEVVVSIQRCTLTSPHMQKILKGLVALGRPIKQADLQAKGVTLRMLLGREPFIEATPASSAAGASSGGLGFLGALSLGSSSKDLKKSGDADLSLSASSSNGDFPARSIAHMPALQHLVSLLADPRSNFSATNARTLAKVLFILKTQQVVDLEQDLPTRFLWFCNLAPSTGSSSGSASAGSSGSEELLSPSSLFLTLRKHFPSRIKRMLIPASPRSGCAFVAFKRVEDAILALLTMLDLRPLRACFGQHFEPQKQHLLFGALKAGILNVAGPLHEGVPGAAGFQPGMSGNGAADSDDLPPPLMASASLPMLGAGARAPSFARTISLARQNSNCPSDAPSQKGKFDLVWSSLWVFVSPPLVVEGVLKRPAVLYALRRTADFDAAHPEQSKWFFRVALTPRCCRITRAGIASIQLVDRTPEGEDGLEAAAADAAAGGASDEDDEFASGAGGDAALAAEDEPRAPGAPILFKDNPNRGRSGSALAAEAAKAPPSKTYYIRVPEGSEAQVDEWLALLKALRAGDTPLSPHKSASPASSPSPPSSVGAVVPMSPLAQPYFAESATRVHCSSCGMHKSIVDIYTLDAALDVAPTQREPVGSGSNVLAPAPAPGSPAHDLAAVGASVGSPSLGSLSTPVAPVTEFNISACRDCLVARIESRIAAKQFDELQAQFSVGDLGDLLPRDRFLAYLDLATATLIDSNSKRFTRCPKCSCPIEIDHHTWSSKGEGVLQGLVGLDRAPLSEEAKQFFLANRFLCRGCRTDFCKGCKCFPFHNGLSCSEFDEFKRSPKCRFCAVTVTAKNRLASPPSLAFAEVCNGAECAEKVAQSCCVMKRCGHPCGGARDEIDCPPCLYPDCEDRDPKMSETREDECAICYTEELGQGPIVRLGCSHVFHLACVRQRLRSKWSSARISFEFKLCALCQAPMSHPLLTDLLRPLYHLESQVKAMSLQRLEFEALQDHTDIVSPEGRYYNDPTGFAMNHYMFYQCYDCQEPYFAGARACGVAGAEEVRREDLICGGCQKVPSFDECPKHGASFLIFKCRFCCSFSTYYCFGKTHFCDACHSGSVWPTLVTSAGVNLKTYDQYSQCAGIKDKVAAVLALGLEKEEMEKRLSHTYCDPAQCPLGIRHLPSGMEFGFGCGMCKPSEQRNSEMDNLQREEDAKIKNMLREAAKEIRRWNVPDEGRLLKAGVELPVEAKDGKKESPAPAAKAIVEEIKHDEEEEQKEQAVPVVELGSLSLHAEAEAGSGSILGLAPPQPQRAPLPAGVDGLEYSVLHTLHPNGDDLEVSLVEGEGSIVPVRSDPRTGGALPEDAQLEGSHWTHVAAKRALAYGCHWMQFKIVSLPPPIYGADDSASPWNAAQLVLGIVSEDVPIPPVGVARAAPHSASCPLDFYSSLAPGFTNTGSRVDPASGALSAPEASMAFREGDVVSLLVDLDQPDGVQLHLYKNGYAVTHKLASYSGLRLAKHAHVRVVASLRGAGHMISLADCNFVDRALWRFEVDNALPVEARMPQGAARVPMLAQQNALKHKARWLPVVPHKVEEDPVPESLGAALAARGSLEEIDEEDGVDEDDEELDLGEGHHDPLTMTLHSRSGAAMVIQDMEVFYGPGGNGQVINLQASAPLPIWGQSGLHYYEIEVVSRGQGCMIGLGVAAPNYAPNRMPGWDPQSFGFHGDDGKAFQGPSGQGRPYGPVWQVGDIIGLCIDRARREIFFTRNGGKLPVAFRDIDLAVDWRPTIGMHSEGERVKVNFTGPFRWQGLAHFPFRPLKNAVSKQGQPVLSEARQKLDRFFANRDRLQREAALAAALRGPELHPLERRKLEKAAAAKAAPAAPAAPANRAGLLGDIRAHGGIGGGDDEERKQGDAADDDAALPPEFQVQEYPPGEWACAACTFLNEEKVLACDMCASPRSKPPPKPVAPAKPVAAAAAAAAAPAAKDDVPPPPPPPPAHLFGPPPAPPMGPPPPPPAPSALHRPPSPPLAAAAASSGPPAAASASALGPAPVLPKLVPPPLGNEELALLPVALLRGMSDPESEDAAFEERLAQVVRDKQAEEERKEREAEENGEFDGVKHKNLVLELQGSAALALDVPLAPAPKGNGGMERFEHQQKESLKAYTLVLDLMLPHGQLVTADGAVKAENLRYFPLFDCLSVVPGNDPMASKSFFVHPSGVVGAINLGARKDPDPVLAPHQWARVAVVVDNVRERWEVYIDGRRAQHVLGNNFKAQIERVRKLELANQSDSVHKKQLRLFAGQIDIRKHDAEVTKCKRLRQVQLFSRALTAAEVWALSGGGGEALAAFPTNNPLGAHYAALSLKSLPPLVGGSAPVHAAQPLMAVDRKNSKMYVLGGMHNAAPGAAIYEIDCRMRPLVLKPLAAPPAGEHKRAHASAVFHAGSVWCFGGREVQGDAALNSLLRFTPATNAFEKLEFPTSTVPPMAGHSAVVIQGKMYVVGADATPVPAGSPAPQLGVWQYDFEKNQWARVEIVHNVKGDMTAAKDRSGSLAGDSASAAAAASASASASAAAASAPVPPSPISRNGNRSRRNSGAPPSPSTASASAAASRPKPRGTSKGVWHACVGSYGTRIVVFGGCNSLYGRKNKFAGKGVAGEFVLDAATLDTPNPQASWRNLLSPVAIGRARGPADATRLYAAGGMFQVGVELMFYGGMGASVRSVLYAYNTNSHMWREVALGPQVNPNAAERPPRAYHSVGYDPLTGTAVIAGGQDISGRALLTADAISFKSVGL